MLSWLCHFYGMCHTYAFIRIGTFLRNEFQIISIIVVRGWGWRSLHPLSSLIFWPTQESDILNQRKNGKRWPVMPIHHVKCLFLDTLALLYTFHWAWVQSQASQSYGLMWWGNLAWNSHHDPWMMFLWLNMVFFSFLARWFVFSL